MLLSHFSIQYFPHLYFSILRLSQVSFSVTNVVFVKRYSRCSKPQTFPLANKDAASQQCTKSLTYHKRTHTHPPPTHPHDLLQPSVLHVVKTLSRIACDVPTIFMTFCKRSQRRASYPQPEGQDRCTA